MERLADEYQDTPGCTAQQHPSAPCTRNHHTMHKKSDHAQEIARPSVYPMPLSLSRWCAFMVHENQLPELQATRLPTPPLDKHTLQLFGLLPCGTTTARKSPTSLTA